MLTLHIALRVYPAISKTPAFYPHDKLKLFELSFRSLVEALGSLPTRLTVLLDSCPPQYKQIIERWAPHIETSFLSLENAGNHATYRMQLDLLRKSDAEFVFLAEDDYLYQPLSLPKIISFMRNHPVAAFVSPYDHPDYYTLSLHDRPARLTYSSGHHWREAATTCLTFLSRPDTLQSNYRALSAFSRGIHDAATWMAITKTHVFHPLRVIRLGLDQKKYARWIIETWKENTRHILFAPKAPLYVPIPSLATHLESSLLAPGVEWDQVAQRFGWRE